jgi:hypothetical protein
VAARWVVAPYHANVIVVAISAHARRSGVVLTIAFYPARVSRVIPSFAARRLPCPDRRMDDHVNNRSKSGGRFSFGQALSLACGPANHLKFGSAGLNGQFKPGDV